MSRVTPPETFYKWSGQSGKSQEFEDAAWDDFVNRFLKNPEYEDYEFHAYFPIYVLTNTSSTSSYGQSGFSGNYVERGTVTGKQATGILVVSRTAVNFFARRDISLKFPFRNPVSKTNLAHFLLTAVSGGNSAFLGYHDNDYHCEIPIKNLNLYTSDNDDFGKLLVFEHPNFSSHYVRSFFTDLPSKILDLVNTLQEQIRLDSTKVSQSAHDKSPQERLKMLDSLFEAGTLNEEEYMAARKRIIDSL